MKSVANRIAAALSYSFFGALLGVFVWVCANPVFSALPLYGGWGAGVLAVIGFLMGLPRFSQPLVSTREYDEVEPQCGRGSECAEDISDLRVTEELPRI